MLTCVWSLKSLCVWVRWACVRFSAVENRPVSVWSEWEHRDVRVSLPSVRTQRSHSLRRSTHICWVLKVLISPAEKTQLCISVDTPFWWLSSPPGCPSQAAYRQYMVVSRVKAVADAETGHQLKYRYYSKYRWLWGFRTSSRIDVNSTEKISDTTDGLLLFLSGLKASLLFFLPDNSSFHSSVEERQKDCRIKQAENTVLVSIIRMYCTCT